MVPMKGLTITFPAQRIRSSFCRMRNNRLGMKTERFCNITTNIVSPAGKKGQICVGLKSMSERIGQNTAKYLGHANLCQGIQIPFD